MMYEMNVLSRTFSPFAQFEIRLLFRLCYSVRNIPTGNIIIYCCYSFCLFRIPSQCHSHSIFFHRLRVLHHYLCHYVIAPISMNLQFFRKTIEFLGFLQIACSRIHTLRLARDVWSNESHDERHKQHSSAVFVSIRASIDCGGVRNRFPENRINSSLALNSVERRIYCRIITFQLHDSIVP